MVESRRAYACEVCNDLHSTATSAERCEAKCRMYTATEQVGEHDEELPDPSEYVWDVVQYFENKAERLKQAEADTTDEIDPETGGKVMRRVSYDGAGPERDS